MCILVKEAQERKTETVKAGEDPISRQYELEECWPRSGLLSADPKRENDE